NLDIHQDASGLHVRTGWSKAPEAAAASEAVNAAGPVSAVSDVPTRAELAALESRLRDELSRATAGANRVSAARAVNAVNTNAGTNSAAVNAEAVRRLKALLDESEKRQQRELALRVGELVRDVNAQRQADLARIDRSLGLIQNNTGVEMMRQRETLNNLLVR